MGYYDRKDFSELIGKTLTSCTDVGYEIVFTTTDGGVYKLYHDQDCCESVYLDDVCGDLSDLVGSPIVQASEETNVDLPPKSEYEVSYTWTFYKLATNKGSVTLRWYGCSNGYYSEKVYFEKVS